MPQTDPEAPMKLAILNNAIAEGEFEQNMEVPIDMSDSEKTQYSNEWRSYRERNTQLTKHRGQAFSLILGQCTQLLQDKMKQDTDWNIGKHFIRSFDFVSIDREDDFGANGGPIPVRHRLRTGTCILRVPTGLLVKPAVVRALQHKSDVGAAIGVTRQHKVLLDYVAMELHTQTFATLGAAEQQTVREDAEERYISYAFLRQSGQQHGNLKVDLQNDFTTGDNRYPKNRQQTLHLLDKYSKTVVPKTTQSEGTSFVQKGGRGKRKGNW